MPCKNRGNILITFKISEIEIFGHTKMVFLKRL